MNNPTMLIYDENGVVWHVRPGEETAPKKLNAIVADAPDNFRAVTVNPKTKEVVFITDK